MTGIGEAYDYVVEEGWVIDISCWNNNATLIEWLVEFQPDLWITQLEEYYDGSQKDIDRSACSHLILIKDANRYLHFKLRWYSEYEYALCREEYNRHKKLHDLIWFTSRNPELWVDCDIATRIQWDPDYEHYTGKPVPVSPDTNV